MRAWATAALAALAVGAAAPAAAEDWYVMIVRPEQMFAADLDSRVREGDFATVRVLNLQAEPEPIGVERRLMTHSVAQYRHDCVRRTMTSLGMVGYDAEGREIGRSGPTGQTMDLPQDDGGALALLCERKTEPWMVHLADVEAVRRWYADWLKTHGGR